VKLFSIHACLLYLLWLPYYTSTRNNTDTTTRLVLAHVLGPNKKKSRHKVQKNNSTQQPKESNTEMTQDGNGDGKNNNNNNRHQTSHSTYPPSPLGILPSIMAYFSMLVIMSIMVVILFASYSWKGNIH
jgi:hypothetical protein